ncbi:UNVERIFIED_ORG: hypothetical protein FHR35_000344 [Microbispora rosea subsp. rosea]
MTVSPGQQRQHHVVQLPPRLGQPVLVAHRPLGVRPALGQPALHQPVEPVGHLSSAREQVVYHWITGLRVRRLWRRVGTGDYRAAVAIAAPDVLFRFAGDTPLSVQARGREAFEAWFRDLFARLPGLRLTLRDVVVRDWPP